MCWGRVRHCKHVEGRRQLGEALPSLPPCVLGIKLRPSDLAKASVPTEPTFQPGVSFLDAGYSVWSEIKSQSEHWVLFYICVYVVCMHANMHVLVCRHTVCTCLTVESWF